MDEEQNGFPWGSVVAGAAIGVVVGGSVALLLAPKAGRETRADVSEALDDLKIRAEQALDELQESTAHLSAKSRQIIEQTRENIVRSVEAGKDAYADKKQELTAQLEAGTQPNQSKTEINKG